ncbi:Endochitinase [Rhodotorula toruloides ATCC 204091]|uniref:BY PROTMAP: gi/342319663/gb/EGU11610.1/ Endochitinase [Rhodotorula glutinis ATCC 204091] n=1 Tax=Rhodotorula toruloides TaxID=5286 RepID=A0A0K3CJV8_RHOTO|nr:Endochitinase [Rhodotorula toruloides ATCC 204091]
MNSYLVVFKPASDGAHAEDSAIDDLASKVEGSGGNIKHRYNSRVMRGFAGTMSEETKGELEKGPIMSAYVTDWLSGATASVPWESVDMAFYCCALTTQTGVGLAPGTSTAGMKKFTSAANAAGKVPVLTIGGWSGSVYFSDLVSTSKKRSAFANTIKSWVTKYGFKGVSLDWEFVGKQGAGNNIVSPSDSANYLSFLAKLRQTLGTTYIISAAVPVVGLTGPGGTILKDVSKFALYLDYIELMAYDMYGAWSKTTGPNSPLYTCEANSDSIDAAVKRWVAAGVASYSHRWKTPKTKLSTTRYNNQTTQAFQALATTGQPTDSGWTVQQMISMGYLSADLTTGQGGYTRYFDSCTQTPFLFNPAGAQKSFITYDDAQSYTAKGKFALAKGLAGVAIYESTGATPAMYAALKTGLKTKSKRALAFGVDDSLTGLEQGGFAGWAVEDSALLEPEMATVRSRCLQS